jgi:hypothetical protein
MFKSENFLLTFYPPHPSPLPAGEREGGAGNFKYVWLEFNPVFVKFDKDMFSWINLNHDLSGLSKTLLIAEQS